MSFALCGNCKLGHEEVPSLNQELYRNRVPRQHYGHGEDSPFWPSAWCPEENPQFNERRNARVALGDQARLEEAKVNAIHNSLDVESGKEVPRLRKESAAKIIQTQFRQRRTRINDRVSFQEVVSECPAESEVPADATPGAPTPSPVASEASSRLKSVSFAGDRSPDAADPVEIKAPVPLTVDELKCANGQKLKGPLPVNLRGLKPGARVQLCGMNSPLLNCMNGYVQARADQGRYTVLISEIGDTITLPALNLKERTGNDDSSSSSESSGSEVFDANNPKERRKLSRRKTAAARKRSLARPFKSMVQQSKMWMHRLSRAAKQFIGEQAKLGEMVEKMADASPDSSVPLLEAWWKEKKRLAKEQLLDVSAPIRKRMLENIGEFVKDAAMKDPDMWPWVRPVVKSAVGGIWDDIEVEIESNIEVALTDHRTETDLLLASFTAPGPRFQSNFNFLNRWGAWYLRLRAFFLFRYLPFNKTFFGKLKDPVYDILVAFTMLPLFGVRFAFFSVLLLMLTVPGPADEYQLVNYILHFKGTMFFTSGVIMLFIGAMQYNRCYMFYPQDTAGCIERAGPGANEWLCTLVLDYLGSISLVWVAWLILPCSRKFPSHVESMRGWSRREEERSTYCCCLEGVTNRGGRLGGLLSYDVVCFFLSFSIMATFYWVTNDPETPLTREAMWGRAKAITYWCQVLYALFSLPFALFIVPVFSWLLTHSTFTGYNPNGACVEFAFSISVPEGDNAQSP